MRRRKIFNVHTDFQNLIGKSTFETFRKSTTSVLDFDLQQQLKSKRNSFFQNHKKNYICN